MEASNLISFGAGFATSMLLQKEPAKIVQQPNIIDKSYSFPDVWKALYETALPSKGELEQLLSYRFFYGPLWHNLSTIYNDTQGDADFGRPRIKEFFDRYQCTSLGITDFSVNTGRHTVFAPSSGAIDSKVCLIKPTVTNGQSSFLITNVGGSDLVSQLNIAVPFRNTLRQFYLRERLAHYIISDFVELQSAGLDNLDQNSPVFLRNLGSLMCSTYGRNRCYNDAKMNAVLDTFDYVSLFSNTAGTQAFVRLKRKNELQGYKKFIDNVIQIIYG